MVNGCRFARWLMDAASRDGMVNSEWDADAQRTD